MTNATQIVVLGIFIFFLIVGVLVFALVGKGGGSLGGVQVRVWGTMPAEMFTTIENTMSTDAPGSLNIIYTEIPPSSFEQTLIEALADGTGPDVVLMPQDLLFKNEKKLSTISFSALSERTFKDSFIEGSETLLTGTGSYGLPLLVDPLVMYWNRDILTSKKIPSPPASWEQVLALSEKLTERKDDKTILKSTVALGDYTNVSHAKDILSALMLQAGNGIVVRDNNSSTGARNVTTDNGGFSVSPIDASFSFFSQFADPLKSIYSWNRSLPLSMDAFLNGDLAFYFGPASEARILRSKNPNLNFDVALLPQPQTAMVKKTFGTIYSFSVLSSSKNQSGAFATISLLTSAKVAKIASDFAGLPPARRDLLATSPGTASGDVFWTSSIWTKTWLDPDPTRTNASFGEAVNSIVTGKAGVSDAARVFDKEIDELVK